VRRERVTVVGLTFVTSEPARRTSPPNSSKEPLSNWQIAHQPITSHGRARRQQPRRSRGSAGRGLNRRPWPSCFAALGARSKGEAIAAARAAFARCQFDEQGCGLGLHRLRAYRKEWDEGRGVRKDRPRHDDASHGADAFLTFACSGDTPLSPTPARKRSFGWVV
jgi:hypothetical protein